MMGIPHHPCIHNIVLVFTTLKMGESSRGLLALLYLTISLTFSGSIPEATPKCSQSQEPAIGDIMVRDGDGAVTIYYADGMHRPQWTPICTSKSGHSVLTVICKQRGYMKAQPTTTPPGTSNTSTILLHGEQLFISTDQKFLEINCGDEPVLHSHILRCGYSVSDACDGILYNSTFYCEEPVTDIKSPPYKGQVHLCPPKDFRTSKCSVSTGLVLIWTYQEWRGINQNSSNFPLISHVADSICRQLGFTNAVVNSAVTLNSTSLNYSHCYDGINTHALVTTDQLNCSTAENCVGCCFKEYPQSQGDFCNECKNITDIVLSCTFDPTISLSKEAANCTFDGLICHPQGIQISTLNLALSISFGASGTYSIIITLILIYVCYRCHRGQRPYVPVPAPPPPAAQPAGPGANPNGARGQGQP